MLKAGMGSKARATIGAGIVALQQLHFVGLHV